MKPLSISVLLVVLGASVLGGWYATGTRGQSGAGPSPPRSNQTKALARQLHKDVEHLAGAIGERHPRRYRSLMRAAAWIEAELRASGYEPARQSFTVHGKRCRNIEVAIEGREHPDEVVVLGAHYDTVPGSPGADDNASGVASLLALARRLHGTALDRTLRMVFFTNEEAPYFHSDAMGSVRYAKRSKARGEKIVGMLSLESMGYYTEAPDSQEYPADAFEALYPSTGNFILFVGNTSSRRLLERALGRFRASAQLPSEGGAVPAATPGVARSDHWSFWQQGYPALMITDTAPFRNPHYHTSHDTPETLDYERLARLTLGLEAVVDELAERA